MRGRRPNIPPDLPGITRFNPDGSQDDSFQFDPERKWGVQGLIPMTDGGALVQAGRLLRLDANRRIVNDYLVGSFWMVGEANGALFVGYPFARLLPLGNTFRGVPSPNRSCKWKKIREPRL